MDLESKTDQWVFGLTTATLSAVFGVSAAYFHSVVRSGNWNSPKKPSSVSKKALEAILEESLQKVKEEAEQTIQEGEAIKSSNQTVDSKSLKKLHNDLENKIKQHTEEIASRHHVQEKGLWSALSYYETDEQIKSLKQRHLQEKPTVLFPSRLLTQIYARMIRQIGKEMEITAEELKKDGHQPNTSSFESAMYRKLEQCKEQALTKILEEYELSNSRLFFHLNVSAFSAIDRDFQSLMDNELKYKIQMLGKVGCEQLAQQMYSAMKQREQQQQQGMMGMGGMM